MAAGVNSIIMYKGKYAPWDFYPKTLLHKEVQNPFGVLADFFSCDHPKGHRKQLKKWRYYATAGDFYNHKRFGPGNLVHTYRLNLNFLEALYLLLLEHQAEWKHEKPGEGQLADEKATWRYFPKNLSEEALLAPFTVVTKAFKKVPLPEYRAHLHDWFEEAISIKTTAETLDPGEVIAVYENLIKLYSAGWLIYQRNAKTPYLKKETGQQEPAVTARAVIPQQWTVAEPQNGFNTGLSKAGRLGLNELVRLITISLPTVKLIVHLGTHPEPFTYYLLILVDNSEKLQEHEISNQIEDKCRPLGRVFAFTHKLSGYKKALEEKRRFFIDAMQTGTVAYVDDGFTIPVLPELSADSISTKAELDYNKWNVQGHDFLRGSRYYRELKNYNLAAFNIHQAVESSLISLIRAVLGYKINVHNLSRMLRITLMFTDELKHVFALDTEERVELFKLLCNAYANARYSSSFQMDEASIETMDNLAVKVLSAAQVVYDQFKEKLSEINAE